MKTLSNYVTIAALAAAPKGYNLLESVSFRYGGWWPEIIETLRRKKPLAVALFCLGK